MNAHARPHERREILSAARRYRRDGYKVSGPDDPAARPSFLGDFVPDLIAERDGDKVIIEVKRATSVRGTNDIIELAEKVAAQPGWRFELIAIPAISQLDMPDLAWAGEDVQRLLDKGFLKPAFIVVYAMIENIVVYASVRRDRNPANSAFAVQLRELVVKGVIDEDTRRKIDEARNLRNALVHDASGPGPTRADVEALMSLGRELQHEVLATAAA